ncbi:hypothetical protein GCM10010255_62510 [Streptomyces coeruleofuscus]|uniref:Alcohol dehydrogenase N-terminal domain-containing protein n=1 Tax=Streptomyces coeruleofuscus TaxID=66879 RepID=A0ABP5VZ60_9ACTN
MKADRLRTPCETGSGGQWCPDDICGVVEAVGTGVTPFKPGDKAFGMLPRA